MRVYMYMAFSVCARVRVRVYLCQCVCTRIALWKRESFCVRVCIRTYVCVRVCVCIYLYVYVYVCICEWVFVRVRTYELSCRRENVCVCVSFCAWVSSRAHDWEKQGVWVWVSVCVCVCVSVYTQRTAEATCKWYMCAEWDYRFPQPHALPHILARRKNRSMRHNSWLNASISSKIDSVFLHFLENKERNIWSIEVFLTERALGHLFSLSFCHIVAYSVGGLEHENFYC